MKDTKYFNEFIKYTLLNIMGMLGLSCYILADTFFVSKGLGSRGLTALNLAIPVYNFIHGTGLMLGIGGATRYSISMGTTKNKGSDTSFTNTVFLGFIMSAIYVSIGLFLSQSLTCALGADESVFHMTNTYLKVLLLFAPAFIFNDILICFIRNDGNPKLSMIAMITGSMSNILLDYIFIFPLNMGIFGAVFATGLAPVISMLILSTFFIRKKHNFHLFKCRIPLLPCFSIAVSGFSSFITEVSSGIVIIVFNIIILKLEGNTGVAAYGIIANLSLVVIAIYTGIAQGIQPIVSRFYGQSQMAAARKILKYATAMVIIISAAIYAAVSLKSSFFVGVFNSENDLSLQLIAEHGIKLYFIGAVFAGINIVLSIYFSSTDHAKPSITVALLRGFILNIPIAFILSYLGNMTGLWLTFPAAEFITMLAGIALFVMISKREIGKT